MKSALCYFRPTQTTRFPIDDNCILYDNNQHSALYENRNETHKDFEKVQSHQRSCDGLQYDDVIAAERYCHAINEMHRKLRCPCSALFN